MLLPSAPAPASHDNWRLERTRREIRATRSKLGRVMERDAEIRAVLARVTKVLALERTRLARAQGRLALVELQARTAKERLTRLSSERKRRSEIISARAAALYIMGPVNEFDAMTEVGSLDEYIRRAGALEFIAAHDRQVIQDLDRIAYETKLARRELRQRTAAAAEVRDEIAARVDTVGDIVDAKRQIHRKLQQRIHAYRRDLAALQRQQSRILQIIRSRSAPSAGPIDTGNPSRLGFIWPTRSRYITSSYGPRWGGFHTGIDIDCRTGDTIVASKGGRVIASEYAGGYGNMVIVDHGGGYSTVYAHLSRRYASGSISRGDSIGACGSTGNSTGDHLHFEVRVNGRHVNPRPYLP